MLRALLDKADENEDFDPALHERILRLLDETPADQLSLTEKFRSALYLQNAVLYIAYKNEWSAEISAPDGKGGHIRQKVVDESRLPFEMAALGKIQSTVGYSRRLQDWIDSQRDAVAARVFEEYGARLQRWPEMAGGEKRQLLQDIVALNLQAYRGKGFEIEVPPVGFDEEISGVAANNHTALTGEGDDAVPAVDAIIASGGLRDMTRVFVPLKLIYHESIHALITQLAAARARGLLSEDDPLYEDAGVALAERRYGAAIPLIPTVYKNDFEEKFVRGCERNFGDSFAEQVVIRRSAPAPAA